MLGQLVFVVGNLGKFETRDCEYKKHWVSNFNAEQSGFLKVLRKPHIKEVLKICKVKNSNENFQILQCKLPNNFFLQKMLVIPAVSKFRASSFKKFGT